MVIFQDAEFLDLAIPSSSYPASIVAWLHHTPCMVSKNHQQKGQNTLFRTASQTPSHAPGDSEVDGALQIRRVPKK
jgi:hypothetical protein